MINSAIIASRFPSSSKSIELLFRRFSNSSCASSIELLKFLYEVYAVPNTCNVISVELSN